MKKTLLTILLGLLLALSACAGPAPAADNPAPQPTAPAAAANTNSTTDQPAATAADSSQATPASPSLDTSYTNAVPVEMQLLLGTLKLSETGQPLSQQQAARLLPLWDALRTASQGAGPGQAGQTNQQLGSSTPPAQPAQQPQALDSATQTKIDGVVKQILAVMTPAQIQAIAAMQITQESALSIMKVEGLTSGGLQQKGSAPQAGQGTPPAGGNGGAGGQPPTGGNGGQAGQGQAPSGGGKLPMELFTALIKNLEKISGTQLPTASPAQ